MKTLIHCDCMLGPSDPSPRCTSCFGTGTPFELFERDRFVNACRIMLNLDAWVLEEAGVIKPGAVGGSDWKRFDDTPLVFIAKANEDSLAALWKLIEEHQPDRLRALVCEGCGTTWTDDELRRKKEADPKLLSCCPERRMVPRYGPIAPRL